MAEIKRLEEQVHMLKNMIFTQAVMRVTSPIIQRLAEQMKAHEKVEWPKELDLPVAPKRAEGE